MSAASATPARLTLRHDWSELARLATWVRQLAADHGASARVAHRLDLVLAELVTNVLTHGLKGGGPADVFVEARRDGEFIRVLISDNGVPFDPFAKELAALPTKLEDASPGGLGLVLVRNNLDESHYERRADRNLVTVSFRLTRDTPGSAPAHA